MTTPASAATRFAALFCVAALAAAACAPAANSVGLDIGETSPPFVMTLADGSQVSSAGLAEADQPAHLFWFATW